MVSLAIAGSPWAATGALGLPAPSAGISKAGSKLTLTGVVTSLGNGRARGSCAKKPKVSLYEGKRVVGSLDVTKCGAALTTSVEEGTAKLDVGNLKGRLRLHVEFHAGGNIDHSVPATDGMGYVENSHGLELLRVKKGEIPTKIGARFTLILNTTVESGV
ncbi:MAG: hypothetical protein WB507_11875 [Solirubrobacterales bacterium]